MPLQLKAAQPLVDEEEEKKKKKALLGNIGILEPPAPPTHVEVTPLESTDPPPVSSLGTRLLGAADASLSIASSVVGFVAGSVNAAGSLVRDISSVIGKGMLPPTGTGHVYGEGDSNILQDLRSIPENMAEEYNVAAETLTWEPRTEQGKRYVGDLGKLFDEVHEFAGETLSAPLRLPREVMIDATGKHIDPSEMEKALFAGGSAGPDILLTLAGGRIAKAETKPVVDRRFVTPTGEPNPVSGIQVGTMKMNALESLTNSKARFASPQEMLQRVDDIAAGKVRNEIVVETKAGLPIRVISGQDTLLVLRNLNAKGVAKIKDVKVRTIEQDVLPVDEASAAKVGLAFINDDKAFEALQARSRAGLIHAATTHFIDASGTVKSALEKLGPLGEEAVKKLVLRAGATPRAQMILSDAWYKIYDGLSTNKGSGAKIAGELIPTELRLFDRFAIAQRTVAIEKTKQGRAVKPKFHGGTTGEDHANWLKAAQRDLGPERFAEYARRAEEIFNLMGQSLRTLRDHGLISGRDYVRLKDINYLTTRYLEHIDPLIEVKELGGKTISVGESGLYPFKRGSKKAQLLDTESIIREYVVRSENRVARNNANKALYQLAEQQPKNPVVSIARVDKKGNIKDPPQGYSLIKVRIDGVTKGMYMPEWLAEGWVASSPEMSVPMANTLRIMSGSFITKPLATGYNPAFALVNMPLDIVHIFMSTSKDYSSFLPMYLGQLGRDVVTVARDAFKKEGRYKDYIMEGGWFDFLSHQGQRVVMFDRGQSYVARHQPKLRFIRDSLGYINEMSEVLTRLAHRERVLRNQASQGKALDPEAATFAARNRLDFHQGGGITKGLDNALPYLNAATQAMRTTARAAGKDPAKFAYKMLQLASVPIGFAAYNMLAHPKVIQQIPQSTRMRNLIIVPPGEPNYIDEDGNKRYVYYAIRKEPLTAAFYNWGELLLYKYMGEEPAISTVQYITQSMPLSLTNVPSLTATFSLMSDYNFWFQDDIFGRDLNVENYAKFTNDTPEIYRNFGEIFNASPEGLRAATRAMIPNNAYVEAGTLMYDNVFADPKDEEAMPWQEMLANMPVVSRVYKVTNPYQVLMEKENHLPNVDNTEHRLAFFELDRRLGRQGKDRYEDARNFASQFQDKDVFLYKDLINRTTGREVLDQFFNKETPTVLNLPRGWWLGLVRESPGRRAELYFDAWRDGTKEERQKMETVAGSLNAAGLNFMDKEFMFKFEAMKQQFNVKVEPMQFEPE